MEKVTEYIQKVKSWILDTKSDLYVATLIFLVSMASFGLGRLSLLWPQKESLRIEQTDNFNQDKRPEIGESNIGDKTEKQTASILSAAKGKYVASKNGTAYHYPWCPGALKIKEENKIWFQAKTEAENRGYKPAGNCEGL